MRSKMIAAKALSSGFQRENSGGKERSVMTSPGAKQRPEDG